MKGQAFEIMGFLILSVTIIVVVVMMRIYLVGGFYKAFQSIQERHEIERLHAGVNSVFFTTEEKSGKSIQELISMAALKGDSKLNLGSNVGEIDLAKELEWRFDAIYGKGNWNLHVEYPKIAPDIQIVFVVDTSASLCDDIEELSKGLPNLIKNMKTYGEKKVFATIYLLEGGLPCCGFTIACEKFEQSIYLNCMSISRNECKGLSGQVISPVSNQPMTEEDWGHGLACAIEEGPKEGWEEFSIKIGIPVSDELPMGSECLGQGYCCANSPGSYRAQYNSLQSGIQKAKDYNVTLFPIKTKPCGNICYNDPDYGKRTVSTELQCACSNLLSQYMDEAAKKTGGKMYELKDSSEIVASVTEIINSVTPKRKPSLEVGTPVPIGKIYVPAVDIPISIPSIGIHTVASVKKWSS